MVEAQTGDKESPITILFLFCHLFVYFDVEWIHINEKIQVEDQMQEKRMSKTCEFIESFIWLLIQITEQMNFASYSCFLVSFPQFQSILSILSKYFNSYDTKFQTKQSDISSSLVLRGFCFCCLHAKEIIRSNTVLEICLLTCEYLPGIISITSSLLMLLGRYAIASAV